MHNIFRSSFYYPLIEVCKSWYCTDITLRSINKSIKPNLFIFHEIFLCVKKTYIKTLFTWVCTFIDVIYKPGKCSGIKCLCHCMSVFFGFVELQRYLCYITTDIYLPEKDHLNCIEHDKISLFLKSNLGFFDNNHTIRPTLLSSSWFRPSNRDIFSIIFSSAEVRAAFSFSVSLKFWVFKYHLLVGNKLKELKY